MLLALCGCQVQSRPTVVVVDCHIHALQEVSEIQNESKYGKCTKNQMHRKILQIEAIDYIRPSKSWIVMSTPCRKCLKLVQKMVGKKLRDIPFKIENRLI